MMEIKDNQIGYDVKTEYEKARQREKQINENKGCILIEKLGNLCCGKEKVHDSQFCKEHFANSYFLKNVYKIQ